MSFKFTALALDHGPSDALEKLILLALCDRSDEQGVSFPSRADLCNRAGCSMSSVARKLRVLEVKGWIQRKQRFNSSSVYRVNVQRLERLEIAAISAKRSILPHGFEAFEDEIANPQCVDIKGEAHSDTGTGHSDTGTGHSDTGTGHSDTGTGHSAASNLSLNPSLNNKKISDFEFKGLKGLSVFQRSSILQDRSVLLAGSMLQAGSAQMQAMRLALRSDCLEQVHRSTQAKL